MTSVKNCFNFILLQNSAYVCVVRLIINTCIELFNFFFLIKKSNKQHFINFIRNNVDQSVIDMFACFNTY